MPLLSCTVDVSSIVEEFPLFSLIESDGGSSSDEDGIDTKASVETSVEKLVLASSKVSIHY